MVLSIAAPLLKSSDCFNCHAGGQIELRLDQPDGELLATADIEVNGQWEQWYDRDVELVGSHGRHDVIVRFVHPVQAGGLMNLDSIHFRPRNRGRFRLGIETASKEVRDRLIQANCRVFHRQEAQ